MQVTSGPMGKEIIHFEAPVPDVVYQEMQDFLKWLNSAAEIDPVLKAAIGHFWFVTIHPFDDGNGRIARAVADMLLARADQSRQRFYSMSAQIQKERNEYYASYRLMHYYRHSGGQSSSLHLYKIDRGGQRNHFPHRYLAI